MIINRFNYEEYFLLYIDNELNAADKEVVENFATANQDLNEELQLLRQSVTRPEKHQVFANKEILLKSILTDDIINKTNYEEYFILYADDELTDSEKAAVENYLSSHPGSQPAFELIRQVKLFPETLVFEEKESLYRQEEVRKPIPMKWWRMAAAVAVILVAGLFWLVQPGGTDTIRVAQKKTDTSNNMVQEKIPVTEPGKLNTTTKVQPAEPESKNMISGKSGNDTHAGKSRGKNKNTTNAHKTIDVAKTTLINQQIKQPAATEDQILVTKNIVADISKHDPVTIGKPLVDRSSGSLRMNNTVITEIQDDNNALAAFDSDSHSENVFLTNIPVSSNAPLRGILRKASRVINKVTALKTGNRPGIIIGNVEIAIQ